MMVKNIRRQTNSSQENKRQIYRTLVMRLNTSKKKSRS